MYLVAMQQLVESASAAERQLAVWELWYGRQCTKMSPIAPPPPYDAKMRADLARAIALGSVAMKRIES